MPTPDSPGNLAVPSAARVAVESLVESQEPPLAHRRYEEATRGFNELQKNTWVRQEAFLIAFAGGGTIAAGIRGSDATYEAVSWWRKHDLLGFVARFEQAHIAYCDLLEDKAHELTMGLKPGQNPLILLARLNAEMPSKYRPAVAAVDETAKELMDQIRSLRKQLPTVAGDTTNGDTTEERLLVMLQRRTSPAGHPPEDPAGLSDGP